MSKPKIGRNDTCPCGSGKKYKNCCMNREEDLAEDFFTRSSQAVASVKLKLDDAYRSGIKRSRRDVQPIFLRYTVNKQMTEELESFFSDWLWFDRQDETGTTYASAYLSEHHQFMPATLQECLNALSASYLSVYKTMQNADTVLEVQDIFTRASHRISLKTKPDIDFNAGPMLLLGRLVEFTEGKVFSGMVLAAEDSEVQVSQLRQHLSYLAAVQNTAAIRQLLKTNAEVLLGLFDHTLKNQSMEINDVRCLPLDDQEQRQVVLQRWEQSSEMDFIHEQQGLIWYQDREAGRNEMAAVANKQVVVCSAALEDLDSWAPVCGGDFPPLKEWPLLAGNFLLQPPPPELSSLWLKVLQEQETERWLNTSQRELNGRTPMEVIKTEQNVGSVLKLLENFAAQPGVTEESSLLLEYMRERLASFHAHPTI